MSARYAQHFLSNAHAAEQIVEALQLTPTDIVFEIGPGNGALTKLLLKKTPRVIAVEIDPDLVKKLRENFKKASQLTLINQDIMDVNLNELPFPPLDLSREGGGIKVVGNLPYNLTSPILRKMSDWTAWTQALFMVQKEVGDRLCAEPGTPEYGAITVGMNLTCQMERVFDLNALSFRPAPKVKSTVVRFIRRPVPLTDNIDQTQTLIQAAFQQRRKTLLNSLSHGLGLPKTKITEWLHSLHIDPMTRPERLTPRQFIQLSEHWRNR